MQNPLEKDTETFFGRAKREKEYEEERWKEELNRRKNPTQAEKSQNFLEKQPLNQRKNAPVKKIKNLIFSIFALNFIIAIVVTFNISTQIQPKFPEESAEFESFTPENEEELTFAFNYPDPELVVGLVESVDVLNEENSWITISYECFGETFTYVHFAENDETIPLNDWYTGRTVKLCVILSDNGLSVILLPDWVTSLTY